MNIEKWDPTLGISRIRKTERETMSHHGVTKVDTGINPWILVGMVALAILSKAVIWILGSWVLFFIVAGAWALWKAYREMKSLGLKIRL